MGVNPGTPERAKRFSAGLAIFRKGELRSERWEGASKARAKRFSAGPDTWHDCSYDLSPKAKRKAR